MGHDGFLFLGGIFLCVFFFLLCLVFKKGDMPACFQVVGNDGGKR